MSVFLCVFGSLAIQQRLTSTISFSQAAQRWLNTLPHETSRRPQGCWLSSGCAGAAEEARGRHARRWRRRRRHPPVSARGGAALVALPFALQQSQRRRLS